MEDIYNCVATSVKLLKRYIKVIYAICLPHSSFWNQNYNHREFSLGLDSKLYLDLLHGAPNAVSLNKTEDLKF